MREKNADKGRTNDNRYDNIRNFDGTPYEGNRKNNERKRANRIKPTHAILVIFAVVFIYLCINLGIYMTKNKVSVFEVEAADVAYQTDFTGICIRNERIVCSEHAGTVNYYIVNGKRASRSSIVYSIDAGGSVAAKLKEDFDLNMLNADEIRQIKSVINTQLINSDSGDIRWADDFENELTDKVYDVVNENLIKNMEYAIEDSNTMTKFYICRTGNSGIISYYSDELAGITADEVTIKTFEKAENYSFSNLRSNGLIGNQDPVYRICLDDEWSIVINVSEEFYTANLDEHNMMVYLDNDITPVEAEINLYSIGKDYFAKLSLNEYMSKYIDKRFINVSFFNELEQGLKIPLSAIAHKEFYIVPLTLFNDENGKAGFILKRENYVPDTGATEYEDIVVQRYYSDGYYAYIELPLLNRGDYVCNPVSGERYKIEATNFLDGVYNVNKGYYIFTQIEKLRSNNEYVIIKRNTAKGVRLYDRIALNSTDATEGKIIY